MFPSPEIFVHFLYVRNICTLSVCQKYLYTFCMSEIFVHFLYVRNICTLSVCQKYLYTFCMSELSVHFLYVRNICTLSVCQNYLYTFCMSELSVHFFVSFRPNFIFYDVNSKLSNLFLACAQSNVLTNKYLDTAVSLIQTSFSSCKFYIALHRYVTVSMPFSYLYIQLNRAIFLHPRIFVTWLTIDNF